MSSTVWLFDPLSKQRLTTSESDCGAGGGVASQVLAKKFNKVVVSEPNKEFLLWAKNRLTPMFPAGKFEFLQEGGEKSSLPSESMDAVTICEALHWCDIPAALAEFHRQLKRGGVLCIMHYSAPYLLNQEAQKIWKGLWNSTMETLEGKIYKRSAKNVSRGYEDIVFEEGQWEKVKRVMVNCNGTWRTLARFCPEEERPPSGTGKDDEVVYEEKNEALGLDVDFENLRAIWFAMLPWDEKDSNKEEWEKLEKLSDGGRYKGYYPATQLIATKK